MLGEVLLQQLVHLDPKLLLVHALRQTAQQFCDVVFSLEVAFWFLVFTCVISFSFALSWNFCFFVTVIFFSCVISFSFVFPWSLFLCCRCGRPSFFSSSAGVPDLPHHWSVSRSSSPSFCRVSFSFVFVQDHLGLGIRSSRSPAGAARR